MNTFSGNSRYPVIKIGAYCVTNYPSELMQSVHESMKISWQFDSGELAKIEHHISLWEEFYRWRKQIRKIHLENFSIFEAQLAHTLQLYINRCLNMCGASLLTQFGEFCCFGIHVDSNFNLVNYALPAWWGEDESSISLSNTSSSDKNSSSTESSSESSYVCAKRRRGQNKNNNDGFETTRNPYACYDNVPTTQEKPCYSFDEECRPSYDYPNYNCPSAGYCNNQSEFPFPQNFYNSLNTPNNEQSQCPLRNFFQNAGNCQSQNGQENEVPVNVSVEIPWEKLSNCPVFSNHLDFIWTNSVPSNANVATPATPGNAYATTPNCNTNCNATTNANTCNATNTNCNGTTPDNANTTRNACENKTPDQKSNNIIDLLFKAFQIPQVNIPNNVCDEVISAVKTENNGQVPNNVMQDLMSSVGDLKTSLTELKKELENEDANQNESSNSESFSDVQE